MQATSEIWNQLLESGKALFESKAIIDGIEHTDISPPVITRALMQDGLSIGNVVSAVCTFTVDASVIVPKSAEVQIKMRLTNGDEDNPVVSEWLPAGTFYVSRRTRDPIMGVLTLECYDALLKTNAEWITAFTTWPQRMIDVLGEIATIIDVDIDERTIINTDAGYAINEPAEGTIMRDVLSVIAAYNGGNWIITPNNKLRLVPINSADNAAEATTDVVDVEITTNSVLSDAAQEITGIRCLNDDETSYLIGDETGIVITTTIPAVIALELSETLLGKTYQAFTLDGCHYNPAAELGDYVRYYDSVSSVIYSEVVTLSVDANGVLSAPDAQEITDEYPYVGKNDKTLVAAKAYVNQVVNNYDEDLTQAEIFKRLTNNGVAQGLVMLNGQLYVNATYIRSGTLDADVVDVINLNADNITSGTIKADRLELMGYDEDMQIVNEYVPATLFYGESIENGWVVKSASAYYGALFQINNADRFKGETGTITFRLDEALGNYEYQEVYDKLVDGEVLEYAQPYTILLPPERSYSSPEDAQEHGTPDASGDIMGRVNDGDEYIYTIEYTIPQDVVSFYRLEFKFNRVRKLVVKFDALPGFRYSDFLSINNVGMKVGNLQIDANGNIASEADLKVTGDFDIGGFYIDDEGYVCQRITSDT